LLKCPTKISGKWKIVIAQMSTWKKKSFRSNVLCPNIDMLLHVRLTLYTVYLKLLVINSCTISLYACFIFDRPYMWYIKLFISLYYLFYCHLFLIYLKVYFYFIGILHNCGQFSPVYELIYCFWFLKYLDFFLIFIYDFLYFNMIYFNFIYENIIRYDEMKFAQMSY
jgi:hypothetical protein